MVDEMTLEQFFLSANQRFTIAPYLFITTPEICGSPDQVAHYHILTI
jgi:hypothetical protein